MYDALEILETAVRELDRELLANKRYLDIHAYRRALRKRIQKHPVEGASAFYTFDELGDMQAANHFGERRRSGELEMRLLPSPPPVDAVSDAAPR
jgi:hypothetical protein